MSVHEVERLEAERARLSAELRRLHAESLRLTIREAVLVPRTLDGLPIGPCADQLRWIAASGVVFGLKESVRDAIGGLDQDLKHARKHARDDAHDEAQRRDRESARLIAAASRLGHELGRLVDECGEACALRSELERRFARDEALGSLTSQAHALEALVELADFEGVDGLEFQVMRAQLEVDTSLALLAAEESVA
jgi:hypothetical protein